MLAFSACFWLRARRENSHSEDKGERNHRRKKTRRKETVYPGIKVNAERKELAVSLLIALTFCLSLTFNCSHFKLQQGRGGEGGGGRGEGAGSKEGRGKAKQKRRHRGSAPLPRCLIPLKDKREVQSPNSNPSLPTLPPLPFLFFSLFSPLFCCVLCGEGWWADPETTTLVA